MAGRRTQRCTVCGDEMRAFCAAELEPAGKKARGFSWPAGQVPKTLGLRENRLVGHSKLGLPLRRRRFAGAERGSRVLQVGLMYGILTPAAGQVPARALGDHRHRGEAPPRVDAVTSGAERPDAAPVVRLFVSVVLLPCRSTRRRRRRAPHAARRAGGRRSIDLGPPPSTVSEIPVN